MMTAAAMPSAFQTPASMAACSTPTASGPWASALGTSTRARVMRRTPRRGSMHLIMAAAAIKALMEWHTASADAVLAELKTSRSGLSGSEARLRLARYGPNELPQQPPVPAWRIFGRQFANLLVAILIVAAAVSLLVLDDGLLDAAVNLAIVILNAAFGFVQEYRAERTVEALKKLAAPTTTVLRDGKPIELPSRELVPG